MVAHPQSVGVQRAACDALASMTNGNAANQTCAGDSGAVEAGAYTGPLVSST
jgi:hypothetical protein